MANCSNLMANLYIHIDRELSNARVPHEHKTIIIVSDTDPELNSAHSITVGGSCARLSKRSKGLHVSLAKA